MSWGLALADARSTGKVIAWVGSAMFAAFAIGAPAGSALYASYGFAAIAIATAAAPLVALAAGLRGCPQSLPRTRARFSFVEVVGAVWVPGLGSALGSVGFGAVTTFVALLFANRGWANGWLAYTAYAVAFILARVFFSHLADTVGGAKVALVCAVIEAVGQAMIWLAVSARDGVGWRRAHRLRLLAGLSRVRRRSRTPRSGAEPRPRHGRLHGLPRSRPRARQPCARVDRGRRET